MSCLDPLIQRAENLGMDLVVVLDVYLGIRFSVFHIVSVLWHMDGLRLNVRAEYLGIDLVVI